MPIKFVLVRHAEAEHNLAFRSSNNDRSVFLNPDFKDSKLTETGKKQAINLAKEISQKYTNVLGLWSSSLSRCIETANEIFEETDVQEYYIHDNLIERQTPGYHFNYRSEKKILKENNGHINMKFIPELPVYWGETENNYSLRSRMHMIFMLLLNLYKDDNGVVIVVGHSDAIFTLTGKELKNAEYVEMSEDEIKNL
jgi:broad specificity phosphatase PhoE